MINGLDPLNGLGYQFWSGIGSGSPIIAAAIATGAAWWHTHNCHEHRCPRISWHPHPEHGHPVCKKHHPHDPRNLSCSDPSSPTSAAP